jgi:hypothetical protein
MFDRRQHLGVCLAQLGMAVVTVSSFTRPTFVSFDVNDTEHDCDVSLGSPSF